MIRAYIVIKVGTGEFTGIEETIKEKIANIPGIVKVDSIFGRFDIIAEVTAENPRELSRLVTDRLKGIPNVASTEPFICH